MFQIVYAEPLYCSITDGLIGSRTTALPMTYRSLPLARKLAVKRSREEYENCGDGHYDVVHAGSFKRCADFAIPADRDTFAEIPF